MKAEIVLKKLNKAVSIIEKVTEKNASLPILENILFEGKENNLFIRATNLHTGLEIKVPAKIEKEGIFAVNGSIINRILASLSSNKNISFEIDGGNLILVTKDSKMKVKIQDHVDFPTLPRAKSSNSFNIKSSDLVEGFRSVFYASSNSEIKPEISSVYVYGEDENLIFVATDSFRLSEKKVKIKGIAELEGIIIPIKNVREIVRIFGNNNENLEMIVDNNQIVLKNTDGDIYFVSRTIEGNFPDYRQIIPTEFDTEAIFLKKEIAESFKTIEPFTDEYKQVLFSLDLDKEECEISAQNKLAGEGKIKVDGKFTGESVDLKFNYTYFIDSLSAIGGDSIIFRIMPNKPILVQGIHDTSFKYLIMPINR